jgi:hypothetical protein
MNTGGKIMKGIRIAAIMMIVAASQAKELTWQNISGDTVITGEECVYNSGLEYNAVSFGHTVDEGANLVVNGVSFYAAGTNGIGFTATSGITIRQSFTDGTACDTSSDKGDFATLETEFQSILGTDTYRDKTKYYEITGLVEGKEYAVQIFVNNSSADRTGAEQTVVNPIKGFSGPAGVAKANIAGAHGGLGSYLQGTFVAAKEVHEFTVGKSQHVNAINIQAVPKQDLEDAVASYAHMAK